MDLVGGRPTPLKHMSASIGMMIILNIWEKKISHVPVTTNQILTGKRHENRKASLRYIEIFDGFLGSWDLECRGHWDHGPTFGTPQRQSNLKLGVRDMIKDIEGLSLWNV